jgi:hypothetical protein
VTLLLSNRQIPFFFYYFVGHKQPTKGIRMLLDRDLLFTGPEENHSCQYFCFSVSSYSVVLRDCFRNSKVLPGDFATISIHNCSTPTFHSYYLQNPCSKFLIKNKPSVLFMKLKWWKFIQVANFTCICQELIY